MKKRILMITGIILYILFLLSLYENVQSHFELSLKNFLVGIINLIIGFSLFYKPIKDFFKRKKIKEFLLTLFIF